MMVERADLSRGSGTIDLEFGNEVLACLVLWLQNVRSTRADISKSQIWAL